MKKLLNQNEKRDRKELSINNPDIQGVCLVVKLSSEINKQISQWETVVVFQGEAGHLHIPIDIPSFTFLM